MKGATAAVIVGGGLAAGYLVYQKIRRTGKELEISHSAAIQDIGLQGVHIRLDVLMRNPSGTGFTIKFPFIRVLYNGSVIGSSSVINRDIKIPGYGEVKIDNIQIAIPVLNILSTGYKVYKELKAKNKITLGLRTTTMIMAAGLKIPFETNEQTSIGFGKQIKK